MSEFIRLLLAFFFILILIRYKVTIGVAMLAAAAFLGLLFQMAPLDLAQAALESTIDHTTLNLLASLILILFLENVMRKTHLLQRMVTAVTALSRDPRLAMALLPAFVGLLPSAGGAAFSAPMVEEASRGLGLSPERKSFINYWYRHLWEPVLPIYPSLIIISQLWKIPIGDVIAIQFPLTVATIVAGIPLAFRGIEKISGKADPGEPQKVVLDLAAGLGPIIAVMFLVLVLNLEIWLSLFLAIAVIVLFYRYTFDKLVKLVREAFSVQIALLVIGVMVFKEILEQSDAISALPAFMASYGIPVIALVFVLPFLVGLMTGIAQAPIAIAFPIIGALLAGGVDVRITPLAFTSGFAGVMLSPTHLCFVLTVKHFKADFGKVLRMVLVPEAAIVLVGAAIYFIR